MSNPAPPTPPSDQEMSLIAHLLELRDRLVRAVIAIIVVFFVLFPFANDIFSFIAEPLTRYLPEGNKMLAIGVISPFLTPLKLSLIAAIFVAMPYLLYQLWSFIAPALYHNEKRIAAPLLFASTALFYAGGAFVFFIVFPLVFKFMAGTTPEGVQIGTDIQLYLDFVIGMFFAFGLAFQVPVITVLLLITGMVSPEKMRHARPYVIVGAFSIAAIITPPDVISQTLLAVPMWFMYEAGLWFGERFVNKKQQEDNASVNQQADIDIPVHEPQHIASSEQPSLPHINRATATSESSKADSTPTETANDAILDNPLDSEDDFERAFAAMDAERAHLQQSSIPTDVDNSESTDQNTTMTHNPHTSVQTS